MKKILSFLSSILVTSSITPTVVSCTSPSNKVRVESVTPSGGWPPAQEDMLPIWQKFYEKAEADIASNVGDIVGTYSGAYIKLYFKYNEMNKNKADTDGYDHYGVPNDEIQSVLDGIANSKEMYEYQKNSLRLYYIESQISIIKNNGHIELSKNELVNLWGMHYFRGYPLFQWAKIYIWGTDPLILYESPIDYDFYTFDAYLQIGSDGTILWDKPPLAPKGGLSVSDYKTKLQLKLRKEYYEAADQIYMSLFPDADKND